MDISPKGRYCCVALQQSINTTQLSQLERRHAVEDSFTSVYYRPVLMTIIWISNRDGVVDQFSSDEYRVLLG